jgi:hypothetical protein
MQRHGVFSVFLVAKNRSGKPRARALFTVYAHGIEAAIDDHYASASRYSQQSDVTVYKEFL